MNALLGYQFFLPILISSPTTFAQFMNFETSGSAENTMNIAGHQQPYYLFIPYWPVAADKSEIAINNMDIPVDRLEKGMNARELLYFTVRKNDTKKGAPFGQMNSKGNFARRYDASANIDTGNDYERQSGFRLLALNGARGFGK